MITGKKGGKHCCKGRAARSSSSSELRGSWHRASRKSQELRQASRDSTGFWHCHQGTCLQDSPCEVRYKPEQVMSPSHKGETGMLSEGLWLALVRGWAQRVGLSAGPQPGLSGCRGMGDEHRCFPYGGASGCKGGRWRRARVQQAHSADAACPAVV